MKRSYPDPSLQEFIDKEIQAAQNIKTQILFTKDYQEIGVHSPQWFDLKKIILSNACESSRFPPRTLLCTLIILRSMQIPCLKRSSTRFLKTLSGTVKTITNIEFSYSILDEGLVVAYQDNGEGIPAEYKEAIFQRKFFRHTGFGLFLSRTILRITGMTIRETGEPGKGARFEILIPAGAYRFTAIQ